MALSQALKADFARDGFVLLRDAVPAAHLDTLERGFLGLVADWGGTTFSSAQSPNLARHLLDHRDLEKRLYDGIRQYPWLAEFAASGPITEAVRDLIGEDIGLLGKIPFRIDLPGLVREMAVWHQDYFYVEGNPDTVTAWVPLQDTPYERGCLMVMPGSHTWGSLAHDKTILGKRHYPSGIFEHPCRYVEMKRGDLLLFHAFLLHSSGVNLSDTLRLSLQPRYSPLAAPTAAAMGPLIAV